jgi:hypothetical protein
LAYGGGFEMARAVEVGNGKIFMWGDEWISYDVEWARVGEYQIERLWLNIFKWLSPEKECQVPIIVL